MSIMSWDEERTYHAPSLAVEEAKEIVELCVDQFSGGNIFELTSWIQRELKEAGLRTQSSQFGRQLADYLKQFEDYDTAIKGIREFTFVK